MAWQARRLPQYVPAPHSDSGRQRGLAFWGIRKPQKRRVTPLTWICLDIIAYPRGKFDLMSSSWLRSLALPSILPTRMYTTGEHVIVESLAKRASLRLVQVGATAA